MVQKRRTRWSRLQPAPPRRSSPSALLLRARRALCPLIASLVIASLWLAAVPVAAAREQSDAWAQVRATLPHDVPVLQPTWLPARFQAAPTLQRACADCPDHRPGYAVEYRSDAGNVLLFLLGGANSARPETREPVTVRGVQGQLEHTAGWPEWEVVWMEGQGLAYAVQAQGVSREEMLLSLDPSEQGGQAPVLPRSGMRRVTPRAISPPTLGLVALSLIGAGAALRRNGRARSSSRHR